MIGNGCGLRPVLPHLETASLRLRRHQRDERKGTRRADRRDRPRDGQSRRRNAARRRQQADRSRAQSRAITAIRSRRGIPKLREEIVNRYRNNYGVELDPETEAIVTIGAKDALAHLLFADRRAGRCVVSPNPAYPIHQYGVLMAEGHACMLPMPDAATFSEAVWKSCTGLRRASRSCC